MQPTFPQVSGNYAGTITFTLPELGQSASCPATTVVTQAGSSVSIAPILLSGGCAGIIDSLPLGTVTITQNGAFDEAGNESFTDPSCGVYTGTGSGGFFRARASFFSHRHVKHLLQLHRDSGTVTLAAWMRLLSGLDGSRKPRPRDGCPLCVSNSQFSR